MRRGAGMTLWLALALASLPASAHRPSDAHLRLDLSSAPVTGRLDVNLRDLDLVLDLDADGDGALTWGELRARHAAIAGYTLSRLQLASGGRPCALSPGPQQLADRGDGTYSVLAFDVRCPGGARPDRVRYSLLFDLDPTHRGLLQVVGADGAGTLVLSPQAPEVSLAGGAPGAWATLRSYWHEGVVHIWIGFDHLLFLVTLLLPAVLVHRQGGWHPRTSLRDAIVDVTGVVTAFTVAHSVTLTLAVLGWVQPPARWVEPLIAATVLLAALNNLFPLWSRRRWALAFALGLVHGFGFAGVLGELGLPDGALLAALAGFNVGVECGQLVVVAAVVPLIWAARNGAVYRRMVLGPGSALVALVALAWLAERTLVPLAAAG